MHISKSALALAVSAAVSASAIGDSGKPGFDAALPSEASHAKTNFKYPIHSKPSGGAVLYDQSGLAEGMAPSQDFQSTFDAYDSQSADDFVVTDAEGWTLSAFNFTMSFVGAAPPYDVVFNVDVYADASGTPGSPVCSYSGLEGTMDPAPDTNVTIALNSPCALAQGTYWVAMVPVIAFPPKTRLSTGFAGTLGNEGVWRQALDGDGTGCTDWAPMSTCVKNGTPVGFGFNNLLFQVIGSVGNGVGCAAGDICLVSTVGTDLTQGACASTDTIDATVGDQLNFCYTITNDTGIALDYHTLSNNVDGTIFSLINQSVPAGGSFQFNWIATVGQTNTYNSTWTAQDVPPGYIAEVTTGSGGDCSDRIFSDGFDNAAVPCPGVSNFIDITGTGTPLGLGDDTPVDVTMPFSFNFYGTTSNLLTVSNNGGALFDAPHSFLGFSNDSLPSASLSAPAILPLWDDFDSGSGEVYTDVRGITPDRQFIVEWFDRVHFRGVSNTDGATFELILNENGTIQFEYADVQYSGFGNLSGDPADCSGGICATIGLQSDATVFDQFSAFEASVTSNSGILWTPSTPQAFTSSDSTTVNVGAPQIVVVPAALTGAGAPGLPGTIPFAIENHGDRDLNWSLDEAAPSNKHFAPPGSRFVMPMGDPTQSTTTRPHLASPHPRKHGAHSAQGNRIALAAGVTAFAADVYFDEFYTLDVTANNGTSLVAGAGGTAFGFKFLDGDFSQAYGIDKFGSQINTFASVSATDGTITPIGASNPSADAGGFTGFAQDPTTGTLYASGTSCGSSSHLYTIDRNTGASTLVGEMPNMPCAIWIAVGPDGLMYSADIVDDAFFAVDKTSGATSLKGSVGFNANYTQDADFDQSTGVLYWAAFNADSFAAEIRTVDLDTGASSLVYSLGLTDISGLATETVGGPCSQPQDLPWLSLSPVSGTTAPSGSSPALASIDGTGTVDGDVLSGTVCVASNDPQNHTVEVPIQYTISLPPPPPPPTVTKAFAPATVLPGDTTTLTITLTNDAAVPADLTAALTDPLPPGLFVAPTPNASSDCGGVVTATAGSTDVTLDSAGSTISAAAACTVVVDVVVGGVGSFVNTIDLGAWQTSIGSNTAPATATVSTTPIAPTMTKEFAPATVLPDAPSTLTITLANGNAVPTGLTASVTDTFPAGLVVAATPNASTTCGGALDATAGSDHVTLDIGAVIPANGTCTISVDTSASLPGSYANSIPIGALQTSAGSNAASADATLVVPAPPTLAKTFSPPITTVGLPSTLMITLANTNATPVNLTSALVDTFPIGLLVAATPNAASDCGGALTATAGTDVVILDAAGSTIPAGGSCTISVDVDAATPNDYLNTLLAGTLLTDAGSNANPASATLSVNP
ncbi:MAG: hypothetical protein ACREPX_09785 [Rhodanobacteraceae bacterium]